MPATSAKAESIGGKLANSIVKDIGELDVRANKPLHFSF
jgi:hypothetical protein